MYLPARKNIRQTIPGARTHAQPPSLVLFQLASDHFFNREFPTSNTRELVVTSKLKKLTRGIQNEVCVDRLTPARYIYFFVAT